YLFPQRKTLREPASMHSFRVAWLAVLTVITGVAFLFLPAPARAQNQQRLVEEVDIIGNRRLRKEDILYYIQTRPGDVFNPQQVERDLQAINALGFFDKTETRVPPKMRHAAACA